MGQALAERVCQFNIIFDNQAGRHVRPNLCLNDVEAHLAGTDPKELAAGGSGHSLCFWGSRLPTNCGGKTFQATRFKGLRVLGFWI